MMMSMMIASLLQHQPVSSLVFEFTGDEKEMGFSLEDWEIHEFGDHSEDDGDGHGDDDDDEEVWNDDKEVLDDDEEVWNDDDDEVWNDDDDNEKHNNEKCRSICTYNNKSSSFAFHDSIIGGGGGVTALMYCFRFDTIRFVFLLFLFLPIYI